MGDLKRRLAKKKMKAEAKAERKNIKSKGKNIDAKNKGYDSQKDKNKSTAENIKVSRTRQVKKGPKTVSTSVSTRGGDKTTINKSKTSVSNTFSGADSSSTE